MNNEIRFSREALDPALRDITTWPAVDPTLLSEKAAEVFERRKAGIRDYLAGCKIAAIRRAHKISWSQLRGLFERCRDTHPDGRIWGERALIPHMRCKSYERRAPVQSKPSGKQGGNSGALQQLFERFPLIREHVDDLFLKRRRKDLVHESRIPIKSIHKRFLDKCRELGIKNEYPFTTKWLGLRALGKYLNQLFRQGKTDAVRARYGRNAARQLGTGTNSNAEGVTRPFQRVQFDGHRIDAFFTFLVQHLFAGVVELTLPRFWILVIQDVYSRAIVGYCLVLNQEYSAADVTRCVRRAIVPWEPKALTIPGLRYSEKGGFPSVIPEFQWAKWTEFFYDNAKANLAQAVRRFLTQVLEGTINAGPIKTPERRAFLERFFHTLEENGIHRLPSTTGSDPKDSRRDKPEEKALQYRIRLEHLEELLDVMIAQYNATPHAGIGYRTPLEMLEFHVTSGGEIHTLPVDRRNEVALLHERVVRNVRGNPKKGRRPYVEYEGVRYQNIVLARSPGLIDKPLMLYVNEEDLRCLHARLENGADLGVLTAHGGWGRTPHTLAMRRAIMSLRRNKLIAYTDNDDPILVYHDHLANEGIKKKRVRGKYVGVKRAASQSMAQPRKKEKQEERIVQLNQYRQPRQPLVRRKTVIL